MRPFHTIALQKRSISTLAVLMALGFSVVFVSGHTEAAIINHGDFSDVPPGTVMYLDVTESSGTDPLPPALYGAPSVTGDLLDFDPVGFVSTVTGGPLDVTDGQLNFTVMSLPGHGFDSFSILESGDYSFSGTGGVGTFASASLSLRVEVLEIDNVPVTTPIILTDLASFSSDLASEGGTSTGLLDWSLLGHVDISGYLGGATLGVTKADVVVNNQLVTDSEADSLSFIAKKDFKVLPDLPDGKIPEPTTLALAMIGACLAGRRRR